MKKLLKPTLIKILVFLSPIIFEIVFWLIVTTARGVSVENISNALEIVWTSLGFPGLILCGFIPFCTEFRGDVIWTNPYLFYLSSFIVFGIWYLISAAIGELITPLYKKFTSFLFSKLHIKPVFVFIFVVLLLVVAFYIFAYFENKAYWYKISDGKNIDVEKWECVEGYLKVQLRNVGFEDVSFDEVPIYVDDSLVLCNWQGSLDVKSTAVCTSNEPLGSRPREHLPDWHDIKVKTPIGSPMTSIYCR